MSDSNPVVDELDVHNGEPLRPTFVDAAGTERIAGPPVDGWTPAQVDPTDEQIAAMDAHNAREAARRAESTNALVDPERLGDTAQPLVQANADYAAELEAAGKKGDNVTEATPDTAAGDPGVTDTTVSDPTPDPVSTPDPIVSEPAPISTPEPVLTDQQNVDAAAVADADANVEAQVEAEKAAAAAQTAQADDAALAAAEANQVTDEEATS